MAHSLELLFLGTGTSAGIPMIGCDCAVCMSDDPRNQRSRPSVLISYPDPTLGPFDGRRRILIDTTPELRAQMVRHRVKRIDGVLYTHAHADHIFGMDDLRRFNAIMKSPIHVYAEQLVIEKFRRMFPYIFEPHTNENQSWVPKLVLNTVEVGRPLAQFGATWTPLRLMHGRLPILGFRVDHRDASLAYCTDVSSIPPETYPQLENLDVLVLDALRYRHHPTHMTIDQALEQVDRIRPRRTFFTHMAHDVEHAQVEAQLPENIRLSYDGLVVYFE